jgi:hypothetical protein
LLLDQNNFFNIQKLNYNLCFSQGDIKATVIDADPDKHMILAFCGQKGFDSLHMWTVVVTRQNGITAPETLRLSAILVKHGYSPLASKIVSWKDCPIYTFIP